MILVTGATGHVGNVLVRALVEQGAAVRAMVLPGDPAATIAELPVERVAGDVLDPASLKAAMVGVDVVYHLAGVISIMPGAEHLMRRVNVEGVRNVATAALDTGVKRLVHVSSIHAFERMHDDSVIDESTPLALTGAAGPYDETKAHGTAAVLDLVKQGLDAVVACPTGIIGPHDYLHSELGDTIVSFAKRRLHLLVQGAFDFVDVRDVAAGLVLAAERGRRGETYILSGTYATILRLRELVQSAAGIHSDHLVLPRYLALGFAHVMQHVYRRIGTTPRFTPYSLNTVYDNAQYSRAKAERELGYTPRPLVETVRDTLAWHHSLSPA